MRSVLIFSFFILGVVSTAFAAPRIEMKTSAGTIIIDLDENAAPQTVKNFLDYAAEGFYDGTIFHRVIKGFMIQGGGYDASENSKFTKSPITNEATNGLKNLKGTIAMARTPEVNSATSQFFINLVDNSFLDHRDMTPRGFGYAVFGKVIEGMDVVEKIGRQKTYAKNSLFRDFPQTQIVIESVKLLD